MTKEKLVAALEAAAQENLLVLGTEAEAFDDVADILLGFMGEMPAPVAPVEGPAEQDPAQRKAREFYQKLYATRKRLYAALDSGDMALATQAGQTMQALHLYKSLVGHGWLLYGEE